jgi:integrase
MKLNQRTATALKLPSGKAEHFYWDDDLRGFGLRVRKDSHRTWVVGYRARGRYRRVTLGDVAKLSAEQARTDAKRIFGDLTRGIDPLAERQAQRLGAAKTLRSVIDTYLKRKQATLRPSSYRMAAAYLTKPRYFGPLHSSGITNIDRADVAVRLTRIEKESGPLVARAARAALAALFTSAWKAGIVPQNIVAATEAPAPAQDRERVLTDDELRLIWNGCANDAYGAIIKLLMLTGCRREEIGGLRWDEIDRDGVLILPPARTKNKRGHRLPLPPLAHRIIAAIPKRGDFLFGSAGFTAWSAGKRDLDERLAGKVDEWRLHDLRRTVATWMAEHGVEPHIVEAVLNHFDGHKAGDAGTYNRAPYAKQIRNALAIWADHVQSIIGGGRRKVLSFPQQS